MFKDVLKYREIDYLLKRQHMGGECVHIKKVNNIDTKQSSKRNIQNPKDKTITWNKETQMTGQHEPLWKPEVKSGAPEG